MATPYQQRGLGESGEMTRKTIPYEYAFRYSLSGVPGTRLSDTVTVSVESTFVAVSIGYGVAPEATTLTFGALRRAAVVPPPAVILSSLPASAGSLFTTTFEDVIRSIASALGERDGTIGPGTAAVLTNGFRLNPRLAQRILLNNGGSGLDSQVLSKMFESVGISNPSQIQFLYALRDDGTGREFQSQPILNTAGLGAADGDRPFRYFATPISFAPRSTIRMDITEISDVKGELHVSLHGYKVLGEAGTPTDRVTAMRRRTPRIRRR